MNILRFPNSLLRERSVEIKNIDAGIIAFKKTMYDNKGCVGIAAPQVGKLIRVAAVDITGHPKAKENHGLIMLINPVINERSGKISGREGCLSVPDFTGNIERSKKICVEYTGVDGKRKTLRATGFEAVVLQHEIDHLDGILFIDRIRNSKRDLFRRAGY